MPHVILCKEAGFFGDHKHVLEPLKNLNVSVDSSFNDEIQSFWILDGDWQFFKDWNFETPFPLGSKSPVVLDPGHIATSQMRSDRTRPRRYRL